MSTMGAGGRMDPTFVKVVDVSNVEHDRLAKVGASISPH